MPGTNGGSSPSCAAARSPLLERLKPLVRSQYGVHAYPRRVHVVECLPKTPSGKIQRFVLRGMSDGDLVGRSRQ
ncbi:AMP-binding enzyme [Streptomyces afghaniensis]|uniref:AMP-binding enzyme n=1 Tax=Streptomyces afghaniensis TaxID=66865 RepID=UPI003F4C7344